jgi:hypothetical protein
MNYSIQVIPAAATRPLRSSVLRPQSPISETIFPGDDDPQTIHFGAVLHSAQGASEHELTKHIIGVASLNRKPAAENLAATAPHETARLLCGPSAWQLRGMATDPTVRGSGAGGALLTACLAHAAKNPQIAPPNPNISNAPGAILWCNARIGVRGFYERYGLTASGDPYDIPTVGPHLFMWKCV